MTEVSEHDSPRRDFQRSMHMIDRIVNPCFWLLLIWQLPSASCYGEIKPSMMTILDLHPTAMLVHERRRRRNLKTTQNEEGTGHSRELFHPKLSAVYATLPKEDAEMSDNFDKIDDSLEQIQDFHQHRHLSRYERRYREEHGLDLYELNYTAPVRRYLQETQKKGGRYNHYASAPLSQGYGTHYANVWVGSPQAQRKSVIVDTGSHYTAFPCKGCDSCGEEHHTDPYFDPSLSKTFRPLTCQECQLGANCRDQQCTFSQSYTEGSSWEAYQVQDMIYLGGRDVLESADPKNKRFAINFMFGCQTSETGLFVTQLADGIMGMSAHEFTLTKQLYDQGKIEHNMFSLCFRRELGTSKKGVTAGAMSLGGMDNRMDSSPMMFAKNVATSGWFTVYVKNIFIRAGGGQLATSKREEGQHVLRIPLDLSAVNSGKGVIVDSGTTDTYLHKKLAKSFAAVWKQVTKKDYSHSGIILTDDQLKRLPTILVQMRAYNQRPDPSLGSPNDIIGLVGALDPTSPYDVMLAIPATHYMEYSPNTGMYTSRLYFTETQGGVLGANAMQGHNVVFDWENGRVGFAESSCEYQDEHSSDLVNDGSVRKQDDRFGNDCILGTPVLTQSCIASVDSKFCSSDGNRVLTGTEIWTRAVENTGTAAGMSCLDVVLVETPFQGDEPPKILCENGLCFEFRPCEVSCKDAPKATEIAKEEGSPVCEDTWSSCDYSCSQSIVNTVKKSDGICHEVSRTQRQCHTGACARDDPCRVPYLVHAVIGFRGANRDMWTLSQQEILRQSIVKTVGHMAEGQVPPFSAGDINILMAAPWTVSDEELGLKVVLQISFFNPNAKVELPESQEGDSKDLDGDEASEEGTKGGNKLTQQLTSSMSYVFNRQVANLKSTCVEKDLYPKAHDALMVHDIFQQDDFVLNLLEEMQSNGKTGMTNVNNSDLMRGSRVLTSWTIRTEIAENGVVPKGLFPPAKFGSIAVSGQTVWICLCLVVMSFGWLVEKFCVKKKEPETDEKSDVVIRRLPTRSGIYEDSESDFDSEDDHIAERQSLLMGRRTKKISLTKGVSRADRQHYLDLFHPRRKKRRRNIGNGHNGNDDYDDDDDSRVSMLSNSSSSSSTAPHNTTSSWLTSFLSGNVKKN